MSETPFEPDEVYEGEPDFDSPQHEDGIQDDMEDTDDAE